MTREEVKKKLREYRSIKKEFDQIELQLARFKKLMGAAAGSNMDGMPHSSSGKSDPVLRKVEQHEALQERYHEKLIALIAAQHEVEDMIETLDSTERRLVRHRYIEGLSWERVCVVMNYSWSQVHQIHRDILDKLSENADL